MMFKKYISIVNKICDYGDFMLTVEVSMASGQRQYDMEGEPVSRHLGKIKKMSGKPCYGLFIAPSINSACVAHLYALYSMNISYYGGKSVIIPLPLRLFRKMVEDSYRATYIPNPNQIRRFFEHSIELVKTSKDEVEWYDKIQQKSVQWLCI